jgi:hypothetical protein
MLLPPLPIKVGKGFGEGGKEQRIHGSQPLFDLAQRRLNRSEQGVDIRSPAVGGGRMPPQEPVRRCPGTF